MAVGLGCVNKLPVNAKAIGALLSASVSCGAEVQVELLTRRPISASITTAPVITASLSTSISMACAVSSAVAINAAIQSGVLLASQVVVLSSWVAALLTETHLASQLQIAPDIEVYMSTGIPLSGAVVCQTRITARCEYDPDEKMRDTIRVYTKPRNLTVWSEA